MRAKEKTIVAVYSGANAFGANWRIIKSATGVYIIYYDEPVNMPNVSAGGSSTTGTWNVYVDRVNDRQFNIRAYAGASAGDPTQLQAITTTLR